MLGQITVLVILTVGAPILNMFGFWMVDGIPLLDDVLFLHGRLFRHIKWQLIFGMAAMP